MTHRHNKAASVGALAAGTEGVLGFLPSHSHCSRSPIGCQEQVAVLNLLLVLYDGSHLSCIARGNEYATGRQHFVLGGEVC
jgi:hypothetical protein